MISAVQNPMLTYATATRFTAVQNPMLTFATATRFTGVCTFLSLSFSRLFPLILLLLLNRSMLLRCGKQALVQRNSGSVVYNLILPAFFLGVACFFQVLSVLHFAVVPAMNFAAVL